VQEVGGGQIVGVLTLKWISKQISFPGVVIVEDDSVVVTAEFALDRKQRNITWGWPVVSEFIELSFTVRFVP
jgi:polyisoprenoid-binding protein YceI